MAHTSGPITKDENGDVWEYIPPNMVKLSGTGSTVVYGPEVDLNSNESVPGPGIWQIVSGDLEAVPGGAVVRQVTIT